MSNIREQFNAKLERFKTVTEEAMVLIRDLSEIALEQFEEHGDTSFFQDLYQAMPKNYARREALVAWGVAHSPLLREGDRFRKDKAEDAVPFNVAAAKDAPFWDFLPEKPEVYYGNDELIGALRRAVKSFHREKHHAVSNVVTFNLAQAEKMIDAFEEGMAKSIEQALDLMAPTELGDISEGEEATAEEAVA